LSRRKPSPGRCEGRSGATEPSSCAEFERVGPGISGEACYPSCDRRGHSKQLTRRHSPTSSAPDSRRLPGRGIAAAAEAPGGGSSGIDYAFDLKNPGRSLPSKAQAVASVEEIDATTRDDLTAYPDARDGRRRLQLPAGSPGRSRAKYDEYAVPVTRPRHIRNRAELIAVTEAAEAYETGNRLVIDEMTAVGLEIGDVLVDGR